MSNPTKLPTRTKIAFGSGSLAFGLKDQALGAFIMIYYNQVIGLPASWVGLAMFIGTLGNAIADPLIGQWSDHFKSRLGRRHPFMYMAALPVALAFALLWSPPAASHEIQFMWLLTTLMLLWASIAAYEVPSSALMAEFTSDYEERTSLSLWRSVFLALGLIGGAIVALKGFLVPTPEQPVGQLNHAGYERYGMVAAIVMFTVILVSTRSTQHLVPGLAPPKPRAAGENLFTNLKLLFADRAYFSLIVCLFFFGVGGGVLGALQTYVQTYFWLLSSDQIAKLAGFAGIGAIVGLVIAGAAKGVDKKVMTISAWGGSLLLCIVPIALQLLGTINLTGGKIVPVLSVTMLLVSAGVTTGIVLGGSMMADVADHIELKTGRRMEALMFAAIIMAQKAVSGMGNFVSGLVLTWIAFPERAVPGQVNATTITHLGATYLISVGSMIFLALVALGFYPISRKTHEQTAAALRAAGTTAAP